MSGLTQHLSGPQDFQNQKQTSPREKKKPVTGEL